MSSDSDEIARESFSDLIWRYVATLEAFREVAEIASNLDKRGSNRMRTLRESFPRFSDPSKEHALDAALTALRGLIAVNLDGTMEGFSAPDDNGYVESGSELVRLRVHRDPEGGYRGGSLDVTDRDVRQVFNALLNDGLASVVTRSQGALVRSSLLTSIIGTFEGLIGDLATSYFVRHPNALGDQPEFSLADLSRFGTVREAQEELIHRKVSNMDQGIDAQVEWFRRRMNIDLPRLSPDWEKLTEMVQRRHVIVHAGGRASHRYVAKVRKASFQIGDDLYVSTDYLNEAIDSFVATGVNLTFAQWFVVSPNERDEAGRNLLNTARRFAQAERWAIVRCICRAGTKISSPDRVRLGFDVLRWLAAKELDLFSEVEEDVQDWDVSALSKEWQLSRACLLNEGDKGAILAAQLVDNGSISAIELLLNPLYRPISNHPAVVKAIEAKGIATDGNSASRMRGPRVATSNDSVHSPTETVDRSASSEGSKEGTDLPEPEQSS